MALTRGFAFAIVPLGRRLLLNSSRPFSTNQDAIINELNQELESILGSAPAAEPSHNFPPSGKTSLDDDHTSTPPHQGSVFIRCNDPEPGPNVPSSVFGTDGNVGLSHVDASGKASMVDVSSKRSSARVAMASGKVLLGPHAFALVKANRIAKGDVLTVAQIAGIQGAKQTSSLIPLCHNVSISHVQVDFKLDERLHGVDIVAKATAAGATGVEMEALTAVSIAGLTIYDMCKAVSKEIEITGIQLDVKTGGKSGDWFRNGSKQ